MRATLALSPKPYNICLAFPASGQSNTVTIVVLYLVLYLPPNAFGSTSLLEEWHKNCPPIVPHDCFPPWLVAAEIGPISGEASLPFPLHVDGCAWKSLIGRPAPRPSPDSSISLPDQHAGNLVGSKIHPFGRGGHPRRCFLYLHPVTPRSPPATDPRPIPSPVPNEKAAQLMESGCFIELTSPEALAARPCCHARNTPVVGLICTFPQTFSLCL